VARAKRTARADARRRYRADQSVPEPLEPSEQSDTTTARPITARDPTPEPGARRSIATAFRESFRPLDIRTDIRALPSIARGSKALWLPVLLTLASTGLFIAVRPTTTTAAPAGSGIDVLAILRLISLFLFQYFIVTPAIGGVFIAGFLAPRASWLLGAIVGLLSAACYSFLILGGFIPLAAGAERPNPSDVVVAAFSISPILGALFASAAAWYRRFLTLSNPNRGRPRQAANAGKRPDGRSRGSGANQKAGVRR
jgi:hypothetical protein